MYVSSDVYRGVRQCGLLGRELRTNNVVEKLGRQFADFSLSVWRKILAGG